MWKFVLSLIWWKLTFQAHAFTEKPDPNCKYNCKQLEMLTEPLLPQQKDVSKVCNCFSDFHVSWCQDWQAGLLWCGRLGLHWTFEEILELSHMPCARSQQITSTRNGWSNSRCEAINRNKYTSLYVCNLSSLIQHLLCAGYMVIETPTAPISRKNLCLVSFGAHNEFNCSHFRRIGLYIDYLNL